MNHLVSASIIASLVISLFIAPGCQKKPKEEVKPAQESKEMVGETVEKGKEMVSETVEAGKVAVSETVEAGKETVGETVDSGKEMMKEAVAGTMVAGKEMVEKPAAGETVEPGKAMAEKAGSNVLVEGEALFKKHCAVCHPDGGNIINSKKTLHKKDLDANNVKTAEDIVKNMRNPGPGMTKFTEDKISDEDAMKIGEYILDTFK